MRKFDEIIDGAGKPPKTFHPIHDRGMGTWFPGNEAAALLIQTGHIGRTSEFFVNGIFASHVGNADLTFPRSQPLSYA